MEKASYSAVSSLNLECLQVPPTSMVAFVLVSRNESSFLYFLWLS